MAAVGDIEVEDETTLVLRLRSPHAFRLVDLSEHAVQDDDRPETRAGPLRVVSLDGMAILEPFQDYYEGPPSVGRVEISNYSSHRSAWTAMMRGEINFLHEVNRDAIDFVQAGGSIQAYPLLRPYYVAVVLNAKHSVLRQQPVRRALAEAVDREEIVRSGMHGHGEIAEGPFWPHHWAYAPAENTSVYNPTAASIRLEKAGFPIRRTPGAMPARLAFTCLLLERDSRFERLALLVQRQLSAVGVDMHLEAVGQNELEQRIASGDYDAFLFELVNARTLSFPYVLWHSSISPLATGYTSADAALDRMNAAGSEHDVRAAVSDVMQVMRDDPPAIFLVWPREMRASDRSIELPYEADRDVFGTLWQARRATPALAGR